MKDSMKMTVPYQFAYLLLIQLAASAVAFLFGIVAFSYFLMLPVAKEIVSVAFMVMNFAMLYIYSKKFAIRDNKQYTSLKPSIAKGVLFGVLIAAVNVIFMLALTFVWKAYGEAGGGLGVLRTAINAVFYVWTFPYCGIMNLNEGHFSIISAIMLVAVPIAATTAGYIAGCRKFELAEKLDTFIYEKEDNEE